MVQLSPTLTLHVESETQHWRAFTQEDIFKSLCIMVSPKLLLTYCNPFQWLKLQHNLGGLEFFLCLQSGHSFTRLLWNGRLVCPHSSYHTDGVDVTTALACGLVCQRLGKTEGKTCAGLFVLVIILCQSQILAHRKIFKQLCQGYFSFSCSRHGHSHGILLFKCRYLHLTLLFKCCYGTMETNTPFQLFFSPRSRHLK